MSSTPEFINLMTHICDMRKRTRNVSGDFSDIETTSVNCFVENIEKIITNKKGEEVKTSSIIFLKDDSGIDINHEYWAFDQTSPYSRPNMEVVEIQRIDDPRTGKTHHYEVFVK